MVDGVAERDQGRGVAYEVGVEFGVCEVASGSGEARGGGQPVLVIGIRERGVVGSGREDGVQELRGIEASGYPVPDREIVGLAVGKLVEVRVDVEGSDAD